MRVAEVSVSAPPSSATTSRGCGTMENTRGLPGVTRATDGHATRAGREPGSADVPGLALVRSGLAEQREEHLDVAQGELLRRAHERQVALARELAQPGERRSPLGLLELGAVPRDELLV